MSGDLSSIPSTPHGGRKEMTPANYPLSCDTMCHSVPSTRQDINACLPNDEYSLHCGSQVLLQSGYHKDQGKFRSPRNSATQGTNIRPVYLTDGFNKIPFQHMNKDTLKSKGHIS